MSKTDTLFIGRTAKRVTLTQICPKNFVQAFFTRDAMLFAYN